MIAMMVTVVTTFQAKLLWETMFPEPSYFNILRIAFVKNTMALVSE